MTRSFVAVVSTRSELPGLCMRVLQKLKLSMQLTSDTGYLFDYAVPNRQVGIAIVDCCQSVLTTGLATIVDLAKKDPGIRIIAIISSRNDRRKAKKAGAHTTLVYPCRERTIKTAIKKLLSP